MADASPTNVVPRTLAAGLARALLERPDEVALIQPARGPAPELRRTRGEVVHDAARLAVALRALGLESGERVLFLSENGPRWLVMDLALLALGCPAVPRGVDSPAEEVAYLVEKVRARFAVVERCSLLAKLPPASVGASEVIVLVDDAESDPPRPEVDSGRRVHFLAALIAGSAANGALESFQTWVAARRPDEVATIVFTSGTSGRPKGVVLTQSNLAENLRQVREVIGFLEGARTFLSVLPPWHMFERMVEYALLGLGVRIVYTDRRHFARDLREWRPDVVAAVPRFWMALAEGVEAEVRKATPARRRLFELAFRVCLAHRRGRRWWRDEEPCLEELGATARAGRALQGLGELCLWPLAVLARVVVLDRVAARLGVDRLERGAGISGGGAIPEHVNLFVEALGVRLLNGYGLTETSPVLALRLPHRNVIGTVGPPVPGTEIRLRHPEHGGPVAAGEQGVLHVRGPQVMRGYHDDPQATLRVLDAEGWFDTGDLCRLNRSGELVVTGRAKDTIVLLSGENVEPEPLENALLESPWIQQAVVVGQDRKFLGALIVPSDLAPSRKTLKDEELAARFRREIDQVVNVRRGFRAHERIVRFRLLERPFSQEDGSISQTLKLKRAVVQERCAADIEALYTEED